MRHQALLVGMFIAVLACSASADSSNSVVFLGSCEQFLKGAKYSGENTVVIPPDGLECWHYVSAYQQASQVIFNGGSSRMFPVCIPEELRTSQLIRIYVNYAQRHPEDLTMSPPITFFNAINTKYPCR